MNTTRSLAVLVGAALLSLALVAGPAVALQPGDPSPAVSALDIAASQLDVAASQLDADVTVLAVAEQERRPIGDSPRNRVGLLLYGALIAGAVFGWIGMRRQLRGDHPKASGEFRWR